MGINAIVGTVDATKKLKNNQEITVSCSEGDIGYIYEGTIPFKENIIDLDKLKIPSKIMFNIGFLKILEILCY